MGEKRQVLILLQDITKVRKFERAKWKDKFKKIYFASVAHDIKTPINNVIGVNESIYPSLNKSQK
jgi:K+-sensing histidine kinase KdpD